MSELEQKILKNHPPENFFEGKFRSLGFERLTEIQKNALQIIYQKKDSLIIAPTGSGKTECAVIPIFSQIKKSKKAGEDQITICYSTKGTQSRCF